MGKKHQLIVTGVAFALLILILITAFAVNRMAGHTKKDPDFGTEESYSAVSDEDVRLTFRESLSKEAFASDKAVSDWLDGLSDRDRVGAFDLYVLAYTAEQEGKTVCTYLICYPEGGSGRHAVPTVSKGTEGGYRIRMAYADGESDGNDHLAALTAVFPSGVVPDIEAVMGETCLDLLVTKAGQPFSLPS